MRKKKSFTLIEMIVVVGVILIALPVLFETIFIIIRQQAFNNRLSQVQQEGEVSLSIIKSLIKNEAVSLYDQTKSTKICSDVVSTPTSFYYFKDKNNNFFRIFSDSYKVASETATGQTVYLTTSKLRLEDLNIDCERTSLYSSPIVSISFNLCYNNNATCSTKSIKFEENASLHYQTKIKLKSFE